MEQNRRKRRKGGKGRKSRRGGGLKMRSRNLGGNREKKPEREVRMRYVRNERETHRKEEGGDLGSGEW